MKTIVISGVNLVEGGIFSVLTDCLDTLIESGISRTHNIIAFVHKKEILQKYEHEIQLIELPKAKSSWGFRLWYEYVYFYQYSKKKNIDIWISLHDMTPNVKAKKRYVYCHNATPFMKIELKNIKYDHKIFLFSLFYKYLYKINIKKNAAVIVQQDWIREEFKKMYSIDNVIVSRPNMSKKVLSEDKVFLTKGNKYIFIFPAYPRFFKNFEIICEASSILEKNGVDNFEVLLTIDGNENRYSKDVVNQYKDLKTVNFIGLQKRNKLFELYSEADCMVFPSKLETWGLPVSEFKETKKPILLANLPYANETIGKYKKVNFFNPEDSDELAKLMNNEINKIGSYQGAEERNLGKSYATNWEELLHLIID